MHEYARQVLTGQIVAGPYVRAACSRHLQDMQTGSARGLRFDPELADHALRFFDHLRLSEGEFSGLPFILTPAQVFIVGSLFGWLGPDGFRRFRLAYIEMGKGSGKTPLLSGIGLYLLLADEEEGAEVFAAAVTREQAGIMFRDAKRMAEGSPALKSRLDIFERNIVHRASGSFFRPVSSEGRSLDGKRVHGALIDEIHEHRTSIVVDKIRAGTKGRRQALICEITNSGYDRHSVCWQHHDYSIKVATGMIENDAWFGYVCALDEGDDWTDEAVWPKANPLLDVSITRKYLREQVAEAQGMPAKENIVKRLSFCIWTEGSGKWLDAAAFGECGEGTVPRPIPVGLTGWGGLDLSSTTDISAFTVIAPRLSCPIGGHAGRCYELRMLAWIPADNIAERIKRDRVPFDVWARDGWITLTPGNRVDQERIFADLEPMGSIVKLLGIDRWNSAWLTPALQGAGFEVVEVGQGYASLSSPAKRLEADIAQRLVHHDGNPVLRWMVSNAIAAEDAAGNIKPDKANSTDRIDGVAAWCDALFVSALEPVGPSVYEREDRGFLEL